MSSIDNRKTRWKKVGYTVGALLCIGLLYAFLYVNAGIHIPCIFRSVTGNLCPGCGISSMCINLLHLNFRGAFYDNPGVMLALPALAVLAAAFLQRFITCGDMRARRWQNILAWVLIVYFILYGIMRNINF